MQQILKMALHNSWLDARSHVKGIWANLFKQKKYTINNKTVEKNLHYGLPFAHDLLIWAAVYNSNQQFAPREVELNLEPEEQNPKYSYINKNKSISPCIIHNEVCRWLNQKAKDANTEMKQALLVSLGKEKNR